MSNTTNNSGGIGFIGMLQIVFITLKLCGVIDWSWWYVLIPAYCMAGLACIAIVLAIAVLALEKKK